MDKLISKHGGYRKLITFQLARLIYDITLRFCDKFIRTGSRTHDQMVQAARSGVQNIAEGSQTSGTSKKTELKLTNVARASLEELRLDYEDFLRQNNLPKWNFNETRCKEVVNRRFSTANEFVLWAKEQNVNVAERAANGMLVLINVACSLLDRQIASQAKAFETEGGFTERLYRVRSEARKKL